MSVTAQGPGLHGGKADVENLFTVNATGQDVTKMTVSFDGPSKPEISFTSTTPGIVNVGYKPKVGGDYNIHVKYNDKHITGSPFKCKITADAEQTKACLAKIKLSGLALKEGKSHLTNEIQLDPREAGITGGLSVAVEGPAKPEVGFKDNGDGTLKLQYKPPAPGQYKIYLKFGEFDVPGTPLDIKVT